MSCTYLHFWCHFFIPSDVVFFVFINHWHYHFFYSSSSSDLIIHSFTVSSIINVHHAQWPFYVLTWIFVVICKIISHFFIIFSDYSFLHVVAKSLHYLNSTFDSKRTSHNILKMMHLCPCTSLFFIDRPGFCDNLLAFCWIKMIFSSL